MTLEAAVFSALTERRGLDEIPDRGFFLVDDQWMTFAERTQHELKVGMEKGFELLAKAGGEEEGLKVLDDLYERYPADVIDAVIAHLGELAAEWVEVSERDALARWPRRGPSWRRLAATPSS